MAEKIVNIEQADHTKQQIKENLDIFEITFDNDGDGRLWARRTNGDIVYIPFEGVANSGDVNLAIKKYEVRKSAGYQIYDSTATIVGTISGANNTVDIEILGRKFSLSAGSFKYFYAGPTGTTEGFEITALGMTTSASGGGSGVNRTLKIGTEFREIGTSPSGAYDNGFYTDNKVVKWKNQKMEVPTTLAEYNAHTNDDILINKRILVAIASGGLQTKIVNGTTSVECLLDGHVNIFPTTGSKIVVTDNVVIAPVTPDGTRSINIHTGSNTTNGGYAVIGATSLISSNPAPGNYSLVELSSSSGELRHFQSSVLRSFVQATQYGCKLKSGSAELTVENGGAVLNTNSVAVYESGSSSTTVNKGILENKILWRSPAPKSGVLKFTGFTVDGVNKKKIILSSETLISFINYSNTVGVVQKKITFASGTETILTPIANTSYWFGAEYNQTTEVATLVVKSIVDDITAEMFVPFGMIWTDASADFTDIIPKPTIGNRDSFDMLEWMRGKKDLFKISGYELSPATGGGNELKLHINNGNSFALGRHFGVDPNNPNKFLNESFPSALSEYFVLNETGAFEVTTTVESDYYSNAGVKTIKTDGYWSVYRVALQPGYTTGIGLQRGNAQYASKNAALNAYSKENLAYHSEFNNAIILGWIVVRKGCTNLGDDLQAEILTYNTQEHSPSLDLVALTVQQSGIISWTGSNIISINVDNTKFDVSDFVLATVDRSDPDPKKHIINQKTISATTANAVTNLTSAIGTWVGVTNSTGFLMQQSTPFTRSQLSTFTPLGFLKHEAKTTVERADPTPLVYESSHDFMGLVSANMALRLSGVSISENSTDLSIKHDTGSVLCMGIGSSRENINDKTISLASNISMIHTYRDSGGAVKFDTATTQVSASKYDDGDGTLGDVGSNEWTNKYIMARFSKTTVDYFHLYGSVKYGTDSTALEGLWKDLVTPTGFNGVFPLCSITLKGNVTNLTTAIGAGDAIIKNTGMHGTAGDGGGGGGSATPVDRQQIIYVGKHGSDTNDGLTPEKAKLTFGSAITYASSQTPAYANRFGIYCDDAGNYTENITVPSWCGVLAPSALITGNHILNDNSLIRSFRLIATTGTAVTKSTGTGACVIDVPRIVLSGMANGLNCSSGEITFTGESVEVENGYAVGHVATSGVIYSNINHINITGSGVGLVVSGSGKIRHMGTSITCSGSGTCFKVYQNGDIDAVCTMVECATVFNLDAATATIHVVASHLEGATINPNGGTIRYDSVNSGKDISGDVKLRNNLNLPSLSVGSIPFIGSDGLVSQDNSNLFWNNGNKRVGIGTITPLESLHIVDGGIRADMTGDSAHFIVNRTDGKVMCLCAGGAASNFRFDDSGDFKIQKQSRANIIAGGGTGVTTIVRVSNGAVANSLVVDSNSNVGIGTNTPDAGSQLHILHNSAQIQLSDGTNKTWLSRYSNRLHIGSTNDIILATGASAETADNRVVINVTGQIDIPGVYAETTTEASNVYVATDGSLRRSTASTAGNIYTTNGTIPSGRTCTLTGSLSFGSNLLYLNEAGNSVGIGTNAPFANGLTIDGGSPHLYWYDTSASANQKLWDFLAHDNIMRFRCVNDANTLAEEFMRVTRTAHAIGVVSIPKGKVGIGISTDAVPLAGVGHALLAIHGKNADGTGPHVQYTTDSDNYPVRQDLHWSHDNINLMFDCYYDGTFKSSHANSNFMIQKLSNVFSIKYDSGNAVGTAVAMENGIVLNSSGNVGIKQGIPAYSLDVVGDVNCTGVYRINGTPISSGYWNQVGSDINYTAGKVGIGTATPKATLQVSDKTCLFTDTAGVAGATILTRNAYRDGTYKRLIATNSASMVLMDAEGDVNFLSNSDANTAVDSDITLQLNMAITKSGPVGIGVSQPKARLQVMDKTGLFTDTAGIGGGTILSRNAYFDSGYKRLLAQNAATMLIMDADGDFNFIANSDALATVDSAITLKSNMVIAQDGNVGIGVEQPKADLQLGDKLGIFNTAVGVTGTVCFSRNAYLDGANYRRLIADNEATMIMQNDEGDFIFYKNSDAGTFTGSVITWQIQMQITNFGQIYTRELTSIAQPPSGYGSFYFNASDSKPYARNDAGTHFDLSGGGSGERSVTYDYSRTGAVGSQTTISSLQGSSSLLGFIPPVNIEIEYIKVTMVLSNATQATQVDFRLAEFTTGATQYAYGNGTTKVNQAIFVVTGAQGSGYYRNATIDLSSSPVAFTAGKMMMIDLGMNFWYATDVQIKVYGKEA